MFQCCKPKQVHASPAEPLQKPTYLIYPQVTIPVSPRPLPQEILSQISVKNIQNQIIVRTDLKNSEFRAEDCENCSFVILDTVRAVTADRCNNCSFFCVVAGSIFLRECQNFNLSSITRQLRLRGSSGLSASLVKSAPVVENCNNIQFGPFKVQFDKDVISQIQTLQQISGVGVNDNKFDQVYDFTAAEGETHFIYEKNLEGMKIELENRTLDEDEKSTELQGQMISNCGFPSVWTGQGQFGLNLTFEVIQIISEFEFVKICKIIKTDDKQRKKLGLSKKEFEFYILVFGEVNQLEQKIQLNSTQFLVLDEVDMNKIQELVV
ncbi:Tubulin binding cofactor C domain-containing protein [Spironucleus salmonicida]|uniref:Tubulin binding cofactor C domain-containing protein n=1 Tax=Spironucleus salmonicida TaxID=348837 RepID=V6M098_9EUKA|nr:Tubulin binding cofactor C domain-containing protein [Spironucleus salmonicida]|eukprot:EST49466.1 Tubulin binding cofactor C domain-containing protein [Spironucleus salmonicida]